MFELNKYKHIYKYLWILGKKEKRRKKKWGEDDDPSSPKHSYEFFQGDLWKKNSVTSLQNTDL